MIADIDGDDDDREQLQGIHQVSRHFSEYLYVHRFI